MPDLLQGFEWKSLFLGNENWGFLLETAFRTLIMFIVIMLSLRILGKRGIKQLSVFELGVIVGLGSAAGDPMFYKDVGLLAGMIVFAIVLSLYRLITYLINRFNEFEQFVEGKPTCIVKEGQFLVTNFKKEPLARDEFFSQLRLKSISHLGQIKQAILETNGEVSVYFYPDEEIKLGLPVIPELCEEVLQVISNEDNYACGFCGHTMLLKAGPGPDCMCCHHKEWIKAINDKRIK